MLLTLQDGLIIFLGIVLEAFPFLLFGVLISSWLQVYVTPERLLSILPRSVVPSVFLGASAGLFFPVCECGNVPVARRLILKGVPLSTVMAFLLAAPVLNPIVIWATWTAFSNDLSMVIGRVVLTFIVVCIMALLFRLAKPEEVLQPKLQVLAVQGREEDLKVGESRLQSFLIVSSEEFISLGKLLVLGGFVAAAVQVLLPRELLVSLGGGSVVSLLAMMLLAFVISICSSVDAFFALSFAGTFSAGSILAFLVWGPMVDLKLISLLSTIFQARAITWLIALTGALTFTLTLFWNYWLL